MKSPKVVAVCKSATHTMSKFTESSINIIEGLGVEGDAHSGKTVKHRSRLKLRPVRPNLRQVHLIHRELFDELKSQGFELTPGLIGENITTEGVDLLSLPEGTILEFEQGAKIRITGLRNPCKQLNGIQPGLMKALVYKNDQGDLVRKAGIMSVVIQGGPVSPGDLISVHLPPQPHKRLEKV